ncbi:MAG: helix-turn-helix domain-containing protein [Methanomicrobiales archaeon]
MEKRIQFISSIDKDIQSIQSSFDWTFLSRREFHPFMVRKIADLSKRYDLQSKTQVPISKNGDRFSYIDVLWLLDGSPLVAFDINTSFRLRNLWKLKNFEVPYRNYVFFGELTHEQYLTIKAIDDTNSITLFEYPDFDRNQLRRGRLKKERSSKRSRKIPIEAETKKEKSKFYDLSSSLRETYRLFNQGISLAEIAHQRNLTVGTIVQHLMRIMQSGEYLDIDHLISPQKQIGITKASQSLDTKRLTPIKELLGEDYSWDEIRLVLVKNERYDLFD